MPIEKQNQILREKFNKQADKINRFKNICIDVKATLLKLQSEYPDKQGELQLDINKLNTILLNN